MCAAMLMIKPRATPTHPTLPTNSTESHETTIVISPIIENIKYNDLLLFLSVESNVSFLHVYYRMTFAKPLEIVLKKLSLSSNFLCIFQVGNPIVQSFSETLVGNTVSIYKFFDDSISGPTMPAPGQSPNHRAET